MTDARPTALEEELAAMRGRIARIEDAERIRQLKYRYFRAMDTADMALLGDQLCDDFRFDFAGAMWRLEGAGRDRFTALMAGNFNRHMATQHHGHHPEIQIAANGTEAHGIWYLQDIVHDTRDATLVFGTNFYDYRYRLTEAGWRIAASRWSRHLEVRQPLPGPIAFADRFLARHGPEATDGG